MNELTNYKSLLLFFFIASICACNQPQKMEEKKQEVVKDSSFIITNIENLDFIEQLNWDFENLYFDSSKKQKFEKLSNVLKIKYLRDFLKYENGSNIENDWIEDDLQAFIIGQRPKINNFQPTLIKVYGTDLAAVIIVNINESGNVISGFPIYSLENIGPEISEDTLIITRTKTKCRFENNIIYTSKLIGTCRPKNSNIQDFIIDQVDFKTIIKENGEIITTKLNKTQYSKKCELDYFQSY